MGQCPNSNILNPKFNQICLKIVLFQKKKKKKNQENIITKKETVTVHIGYSDNAGGIYFWVKFHYIQ